MRLILGICLLLMLLSCGERNSDDGDCSPGLPEERYGLTSYEPRNCPQYVVAFDYLVEEGYRLHILASFEKWKRLAHADDVVFLTSESPSAKGGVRCQINIWETPHPFFDGYERDGFSITERFVSNSVPISASIWVREGGFIFNGTTKESLTLHEVGHVMGLTMHTDADNVMTTDPIFFGSTAIAEWQEVWLQHVWERVKTP